MRFWAAAIVRFIAASVIAGAVIWGAAQAEVAPANVAWGEGNVIAESLSGTPGNAGEGAKIYAEKSLGNCVACHVVSNSEADFQGNVGPSLDGAGSRWTEEQLRAIVADAKHVFPDSVMPSFYKTSGYVRPGEGFTGKPAQEPLKPLLTAQQIEDVVAYLATQKE